MLWKIMQDGSVDIIQFKQKHSQSAMMTGFIFFREWNKAAPESVMVFTSQPKILRMAALKSGTPTKDLSTFAPHNYNIQVSGVFKACDYQSAIK